MPLLSAQEMAVRLARLRQAPRPSPTIVHPAPQALPLAGTVTFCGWHVRSQTKLTAGTMNILRALIHEGEVRPEKRVNVLGVWKTFTHEQLRRFSFFASDNRHLIAVRGWRLVWLPYRRPATAERARVVKSPEELRAAAILRRVLKKLRGIPSMTPEKRAEIADMWQSRALRSKGLKAKKAWSMYYRFK